MGEGGNPRALQKGLIIKLPKRGDLKSCENWRGITVLSVPGKVLRRININRKLRKEQARFRQGKGYTNQIFILSNIIEQSIEWNSPLFINFVDFKRDLDSIHGGSLWGIMSSYGFHIRL